MFPRSHSVAALLTVISAVACSGGGGGGAASTKPAVKIAWMSKGVCNSFFTLSRQGAALAGQDLSGASGRSVDVQMLEPNDCPTDAGSAGDAGPTTTCASNAYNQPELIQQAIDKKVDAIALDSADPKCEGPMVNLAVAAGIKVITFDSDAPASMRNTYYGSDNVAGSALLVDKLATLIGDSGKIIMMTSMFKDTNGVYQLSPSGTYADRQTGFTRQMANHPNIQVVATVPCVGNSVTDSFCATQIEQQLTANPDLKGIYFARGKILREVNLATTAPQFTAGMKAHTLHAVAFDAPIDAIDNIKAGYADFVLNQKLFGWGYDVVTLAYDMVTINRTVAAFTDSGFDAICQSNLDQFIGFMNAQDFRKPLASCQ
jgi:ABC-type sugar transport system substrate-binding protein